MTDNLNTRNAGKNYQQKANQNQQKASQFQQEAAEELTKANKNLQKAYVTQPLGQNNYAQNNYAQDNNAGFNNNQYQQETSGNIVPDLSEEAAFKTFKANKKSQPKNQ